MGAVFAIFFGLLFLGLAGSRKFAWPSWPPGPEMLPYLYFFSGLYGVIGGINLLRRLKGR